jgi:hypothetical protein
VKFGAHYMLACNCCCIRCFITLLCAKQSAVFIVKGQDISGACGQLVVETSQSGSGGGKGHRPVADIEEVGRRRMDVLAS